MNWKTTSTDLNDPSSVLNLYAKRLHHIDNWEKLSPMQSQDVFTYVLSDYYDHGLSLDVLINIAKFMSDEFGNKLDAQFFDLLISIVELDYGFRHVTNDDSSSTHIISTLKSMYNFFELNKHNINSKPSTLPHTNL